MVVFPNQRPPTVMVVDQTPVDRSLVRHALGTDCIVVEESRGDEALDAMVRSPPDLVLLEVHLSPAGGFEVCRRMRANPRLAGIPVAFVTTRGDLQDELEGFASGASDYLTKPVRVQVLKARVGALLAGRFLASNLTRRVGQVSLAHDLSLVALSAMAESRSRITIPHLLRSRYLVEALCRKLQVHPRFSSVLTDDGIRMFSLSIPFYDIGMIGLPPQLLSRPGRLNPQERKLMKTHCELGWAAFAPCEEIAAESGLEFRLIRDLMMAHHEWWNCSGYPQGLRGEAIPPAARILALVDVYDALMSRRLHKEAWSEARVIRTLSRRSGTQFDPAVVAAFLCLSHEFLGIFQRFSD